MSTGSGKSEAEGYPAHASVDARVKGSSPECEHVWQVLRGLGNAEPDDAAMAELLEHFANCAACLDAEASVESLLALYRAGDVISLPPHLEQRLLDCVCGAEGAKKKG